MKTTDLPASENVEDRRGEKFTKPEGMTLAEMLVWAENKRRLNKPVPDDSALPLAAGVNDIKPKTCGDT